MPTRPLVFLFVCLVGLLWGKPAKITLFRVSDTLPPYCDFRSPLSKAIMGETKFVSEKEKVLDA